MNVWLLSIVCGYWKDHVPLLPPPKYVLGFSVYQAIITSVPYVRPNCCKRRI